MTIRYMATKTRLGVFETNSSSCHTFQFSNVDVRNHEKPSGPVYVPGTGHYDWGPDAVRGWEEKADYFAILFRAYHDKLALLKKVLEEELGVEVFLNEAKDAPAGNGRIDHQSMLFELLYRENPCDWDEGKLKDFIFNNNCWIEISNDNI